MGTLSGRELYQLVERHHSFSTEKRVARPSGVLKFETVKSNTTPSKRRLGLRVVRALKEQASNPTFATPTAAQKSARLPNKASPKSQQASYQSNAGRQTTLNDHFSVRRSSRVPSSKLVKEREEDIGLRIREGLEDGLVKSEEGEKGFGIRTTREFRQGEFVCEYSGELVSKACAVERELAYAADLAAGCYMYYFAFQNQEWCVDATVCGRFGRLINHSARHGNLVTRALAVDGIPRLCFFARRALRCGEELLYDYGDRRAAAIAAHPWLRV
jgi:histone-lysine N-methyltransferase SETD8